MNEKKEKRYCPFRKSARRIDKTFEYRVFFEKCHGAYCMAYENGKCKRIEVEAEHGKDRTT